jgi:4-amino-4-deoxy-L-arabinose transferase-like glycosyltransferase
LKIDFVSTDTLPFYLVPIGVFLIIVSPNILSEGMFMDGLIYSVIANNLANGIGTFWNPHFTATCYPGFHEHPPLAIGLQSIFYSLFGESRYIDKIYSTLTFVITGYILLKIWKALGYKYSWLPLIFWFSVPLVSWACTNNMLENTLTIFTSLSVLLYLKSQKNNPMLFIFLSGFILAIGFLTKGFVAFFPWTFPLILWFLLRRKSFRDSAVDSFGIFIFTALPLLMLVLIFPEAKISLHTYIGTQVINSIKNVATVDSRFFIVSRLFSELIPAFGLCILFIIWGFRRKFPIQLLKVNLKSGLVYILLGLTGVLPVMISMKQSGFYILATFPFFAIGLSILIIPLIDFLISRIDFQSKGFYIFKWIGYVFFFTGILLSIYFADQYGRDKTKIIDTHLILTELPSGSIINVTPATWQDWSLQGYFGRYKNISLDPDIKNKRLYFLLKNEEYSDTITREFKIKELRTTDYKLFIRK